MTTKILMSEHASRVLIDWEITIGDDVLSGTWAFDRKTWTRMSRGERFDLLQESAMEERNRHAGWENFGVDCDTIGDAKFQFVPRQPLGPLDW